MGLEQVIKQSVSYEYMIYFDAEGASVLVRPVGSGLRYVEEHNGAYDSCAAYVEQQIAADARVDADDAQWGCFAECEEHVKHTGNAVKVGDITRFTPDVFKMWKAWADAFSLRLWWDGDTVWMGHPIRDQEVTT